LKRKVDAAKDYHRIAKAITRSVINWAKFMLWIGKGITSNARALGKLNNLYSIAAYSIQAQPFDEIYNNWRSLLDTIGEY